MPCIVSCRSRYTAWFQQPLRQKQLFLYIFDAQENAHAKPRIYAFSIYRLHQGDAAFRFQWATVWVQIPLPVPSPAQRIAVRGLFFFPELLVPPRVLRTLSADPPGYTLRRRVAPHRVQSTGGFLLTAAPQIWQMGLFRDDRGRIFLDHSGFLCCAKNLVLQAVPVHGRHEIADR